MMILDAIFASQAQENAGVRERAIASFLKFIERKLDVSVVRDARRYEANPSLSSPLALASLLRKNGITSAFGRASTLPDEPPMKLWYAVITDRANHKVAGVSWENDEDAINATLAEAMERYIWMSQNDHFINPKRATVDEIKSFGYFIPPERFVGYGDKQRATNPALQFRADSEYLWIQGESLISGSPVYVPAQAASPFVVHGNLRVKSEPEIRQPTTNGLATWPTRAGAQLAGALEIVEREAYMVMWLNQLTLPKISLKPLCDNNPDLARCIELCEKYRLKTHAIQLITDAPTHAVAVVMEDMSGLAPRFTIGIRAHRVLSVAIKKAMTEALRAHLGCRRWLDDNTWDTSTPVLNIGHQERVYYWSVPENAEKLKFMIQGKEVEVPASEWDNDTEEEQLEQVIAWCARKGFECITVPLTHSSANVTPWHIEVVIIPELHPTYLHEHVRAFGGTRLHDIPKEFGYTPREFPFSDRPHPFS